MRVLCAVLDNSSALPFLAEAAATLSLRVAIGEGALFLGLGEGEKKFSEKFITEKLHSLGQLFGTGLRIASASDPALALAYARTNLRKRTALPLHTLPFFLNPFAPSTVSCDVLADLSQQGIFSFALLEASPIDQLPQRSRADALLARERWAHSPSNWQWPEFEPIDPLAEWVVSANDESQLLQGLERLLARLHGRGHFLIALALKDGMGRERELRVTQTQNSALLLLAELQRLSDLDFSTGLKIEVSESLPGLDTQFAEREVWRSLVALLRQKVDSQRLALPTRGLAREEASETQAPLFPFSRSLSVFRRPEPLEWSEQGLVRQGQMARLISLAGPATIKGEWWFSEGERQYYRASLASGEEWWFFRTAKNALFLHGVAL